MFGFIVGTLSLIGLIKVARWGRYGGRRGFGSFWLRRLYERLDTTPGQEKVIAEAFDSGQRAAWHAREEFFRARADYAKALRQEQFDEAAVNAAFEKQQTALDELKATLKQQLGAVHAALDPRQREELADLIEFGPGRMHGGWHSRGHRFHHRGPMGPASVNV